MGHCTLPLRLVDRPLALERLQFPLDRPLTVEVGEFGLEAGGVLQIGFGGEFVGATAEAIFPTIEASLRRREA
jgi:hypothetical protein